MYRLSHRFGWPSARYVHAPCLPMSGLPRRLGPHLRGQSSLYLMHMHFAAAVTKVRRLVRRLLCMVARSLNLCARSVAIVEAVNWGAERITQRCLPPWQRRSCHGPLSFSSSSTARETYCMRLKFSSGGSHSYARSTLSIQPYQLLTPLKHLDDSGSAS